MNKLEEKSFPRGGKEPALAVKSKVSKTSHFKRKTDDVEEVESKAVKKRRLKDPSGLKDVSFKTLTEGMVILGCIRDVGEFELKINLPGRIVGYVPVTSVSDEYSSYLQHLMSGKETKAFELNQMFKCGQFVVTKVEEISPLGNERVKVKLSLNPKAVLSEISRKDVVKGLILPASVQSVEDHGYVMNCGIQGVRAFLKKSCVMKYEEIWNNGKPLGAGQVVRCLVSKCSECEGYANVKLIADPDSVGDSQMNATNLSLKTVLPGMLFSVSINKITSDGIIVNVSNDQMGYVHHHYLSDALNEIKKEATCTGRVLYVEPLSKRIYLTMLDNVCGPYPLADPFQSFKKGQVFKKAMVIDSHDGHLELKLEENADLVCVSVRQLDIDDNDTAEQNLSEIIRKTYPIGSVHKCKVLEYDYMLQKYVGSLKRNVIKQKFSSLEEIVAGTVTTCIVEKSSPREIKLHVGAIRGIVEPMHCSDIPVKNPDTLFQKGQKVKARVLAVKPPICEFTLKPTLVHSRNPLLTKLSEAQCGVPYDGVVVSVALAGVVVKFYQDFKCFVTAQNVLGGRENLLNQYHVGQVVTCYVQKIKFDKQKLLLSVQPHLGNEAGESGNDLGSCFLKVGKSYPLCVEKATAKGLTVSEEGTGVKGWIPSQQLADSLDMGNLLWETYKKGETLYGFCLHSSDRPVFSISPTFGKYFESPLGKRLTKKGMSEFTVGTVVPSRITEITSSGITVTVPMRGETCIITVGKNQICDGTCEDVLSLGLQLQQTLMVKMLGISKGSVPSGTCRLARVLDSGSVVESGIALLQNYMAAHKRIHSFLKTTNHPLGELRIGDVVQGRVKAVTSIGVVLELSNGAQAVMMPDHYEGTELKEDMVIDGVAIFIDIANKCVEISTDDEVASSFSSLGKFPAVGRVTKSVAVLVSKPDIQVASVLHDGGQQIIFIPSRWHINDLCPSPFFSVAGRGKVEMRVVEDDLGIAVPRKVVVEEEKLKQKQKNKIIKSENGLDLDASNTFHSTNGEIVSEHEKSPEEILENVEGKKNKIRKGGTSAENSAFLGTEECLNSKHKFKKHVNGVNEGEEGEEDEEPNNRSLNCHTMSIDNTEVERPGKSKKKKRVDISEESGRENIADSSVKCLNVSAGFVWDATPDQLPVVASLKAGGEDLSSDEEVSEDTKRNKKRHSNVAEKRDVARQEEERLRKVEERLMDAEKNPQSADDFDRLVMSAPNNSQNWIKYMAHHLEATEIPKARAVAQRALKMISFREEQEKLNVWMALLNLENLFGTQESLEQTLDEAVKMNEPYKVHQQVLHMYSASKKIEELDKLVQLVTKKYKNQKDAWLQAGMAFIKCGEVERSRQLMQRALKVLDKRDHVEVLTKFARFENEWGEPERGETIMENVLTSYPKRIDVWCVYVDMLVKSNKLDLARNVLDRAVALKLPAGKMKSLFKKYMKFEQAHGTPEAVEKVCEMAKNYVESVHT